MVLPRDLLDRARYRGLPDTTDDDEAISREAARIRAREQLEQIAKRIAGPDVRVADPDTFTRFLAQADASHRAQGGGGIAELALPQNSNANLPPTVDMGARILPREQRNNQAQAQAFRAGAPRGLLERAEIASLPLAAFSPATLAGAIGGTAAQEGAARAGGGPVAQLAAGLAGGIAAGSPESVTGAARLAARGVQAAGRAPVLVADRAINVAQGRQIAHAATEQTIPPAAAQEITRAPTDVERRFLRVQIGQRIAEAKRKLATSPQDQGLQAALAKLETDREALKSGTYAVSVNPNDSAEKLSGLIQQAGTARVDTTALYRVERGRRLGRAIRASKAAGPNEKLKAFRSQLGGELPKRGFAPIVDGLEPTDIESLNTRIWADDSPLNWYEKGNAAEALQNLLLPDVATPPRDFEIELLERVFGPKLGDALRMTRGNWGKARDLLSDVLGIPKTLRSSFDLSAPMRQGVFLAPRHPKEWVGNLANMFKAAASDEASVRIYEDILNDTDFATLVGSVNPRNQKLAILDPLATTKGLGGREEFFVSRLIQRVPGIGLGVRASERAYITFLNKLRYDVAKMTITNWRDAAKKTGVAFEDYAPPEALDRMTRALNIMTGRGDLGKFKAMQSELTAAFWSPQLTVSRFQVPYEALIKGPVVARRSAADTALSKQMAAEFAAFMAAGGSVLFMVERSGLADTELDPRSSNFGKVVVKGGATIDFWGGFQQPVRYAAQLMSLKRKPTSKTTTRGGVKTRTELPPGGDTGLQRVSLGDTMERFVRSKLAPGVPTMLADEAHRSTFMGTPLNAQTPLLGVGPDVQVRLDEYAQQITPLFEMQLLQAMDEYGLSGVMIAAPGLFGVGVQIRSDMTEAGGSIAANQGAKQPARVPPFIR